jgi:hypothetical protein
LGVCVRGVVLALGLQVVEPDDAAPVRVAADGDDPRAGGLEQPLQHKAGEREVAEVVRGERELEAVGGALVRHMHHPCVVDQQVEARTGGANLVGGLANRGERGEVEPDDLRLRLSALGTDAAGFELTLFDVPAGQDDSRSTRGQDPGDFKAETGAGAGHDRGPSRLIGERIHHVI